MCDAIAFMAVSTLATIGSIGVNYATQSANAKTQMAFQKMVYDQNKTLTEASLVNEYAAINERQSEERAKASQEIGAIMQQARAARSTAYLSSLEQGVSGLSVDSLLNDYAQKEAQFITRTQEQERATLMQIQRERIGLGYDAVGRLISATPRPIQGPSGIAAAISGAAAATSFFAAEVPEAGSTVFDRMFNSPSSG